MPVNSSDVSSKRRGKVEQGQRHIVTVSRRLKESPGSEGKAGSLVLSKPLTVKVDTGKDRSSDHNLTLFDRYSLSALPESLPS